MIIILYKIKWRKEDVIFNFLKGKQAEFTVVLDRPQGIYYAGEQINVAVDLTPAKDLELQNAAVRLIGVESFRYRDVSTIDGRVRETYQWEDNELCWASRCYLRVSIYLSRLPAPDKSQIIARADVVKFKGSAYGLN